MAKTIDRGTTIKLADKTAIAAAIMEELRQLGIEQLPAPDNAGLRQLMVEEGIDPNANEFSSQILADRYH